MASEEEEPRDSNRWRGGVRGAGPDRREEGERKADEGAKSME